MSLPRAARGTLALAAALTLGTSATAAASVQESLQAQAQRTPGTQLDVVVQFDATTPAAQRAALVRAAGGRVTRQLPIVNGAGVRISARGAAVLGHQAGVHHVSRNSAVREASRRPEPTEDAPATSFLASSRVPKAWRMGGTGAGVGIAVIDTGIAGDLADFRRSQGDTSSRVIASAVTDEAATTATDRYGHGTHVAGIAAGNGGARNPADPMRGRYAGAAPEADLVSVKASADNGDSTVMDVIAGVQFAIDHRDELGIRVINLSASAMEPESYKLDPLDAAVESAWLHGIVVVVAAGNRGADPGSVGYAPGNDPYVISVGAVDDKGTKNTGDDETTSWSSRGTTQDGVPKPDVLAPGAHIVAPLAPGSAFASLCPTCVRGDGQYFQVSGTSMAAPVVAGIAADLLSVRPDLQPDAVKAAVVAGTRPTSDGGREIAADQVLRLGAKGRLPAANQGLTPNPVVDPLTGSIDFDKLSWGKLSWGQASGELVAPWAKLSWGKLSWGCESCTPTGDAQADKLSWGKLSWGKLSWGKLSWGAFLGEDPQSELSGAASGSQSRG